MKLNNALALMPWNVLRDALEDLEIAEHSEKVKVDMDHSWHEAASDGVCYQCLAGTVMSNTLEADSYETIYPDEYESDFDERGVSVYDKLQYLDNMRYYKNPYNILKETSKIFKLALICNAPDMYNMELPGEITYQADPKKFKESMLQLANILENLYISETV